MSKIRHPCAGMTPAQRRDFELIAIGMRPLGGFTTITRLKDRGLIVDGPLEYVGRDQFGDIRIPTWRVPLPIHMQWCEWCAVDRPRRCRAKPKRAALEIVK